MYALSTRPYVIRDQPDLDTNPEEKLRRSHADLLSINELLRVILGSATTDTLHLADYGSGLLTTLHTVDDIQRIWKISEEEAVRLLAVVNIGRRLFSPPAGSMITLRGIDDVFNAYRSMSSLPKEELRVLLINSRYQLVHESTVAMGDLDSLSISPREVFQPAVERRVSAIVLVHNHPSGDPTPSSSDYQLTKVIKEAGELLHIELLDHVIIGHDSFQSCMQSGV